MTTVEKLKEILADTMCIKEEDVNENIGFVRAFGMDSLDTALFFMKIEREFGIEIPSIISHSINLVEMAQYIDSALKRKAEKAAHSPKTTIINFAMFNLARKKSK